MCFKGTFSRERTKQIGKCLEPQKWTIDLFKYFWNTGRLFKKFVFITGIQYTGKSKFCTLKPNCKISRASRRRARTVIFVHFSFLFFEGPAGKRSFFVRGPGGEINARKIKVLIFSPVRARCGPDDSLYPFFSWQRPLFSMQQVLHFL
jgi:hypothetical protein